MIRLALIFTACGTAAALASQAIPTSAAAGQKWYENAVKKVEGSFAPTEAKPGQTVTFSLTVELNEGYYTYPVLQTDKGAEGMINHIKFPGPGNVIFVGETQDPKNVKAKAEPLLRIAELRYCEGVVVYTRKAVVSPKAASGPTTAKLESFKLSVCNKDNCYPPKTVPVEATLKILPGPAVAVEKDYAEEVKKALGEK